MKQILITNDDGFDAIGLKALVEALRPLAKITVVAPSKNKSACGHSLTLDKPLRFVTVDDDWYKLDDGSPTDCVYLSLNNLFKDGYKPDLVLSGINFGSNMGEDTTYSGTVAAAMEAVIQGIPAIAISQVISEGFDSITSENDFKLAQKAIAELVRKIFDGSFPLGERKLLNVNIPQIDIEECKGFKITNIGYRIYGNDTHRHTNPRGEEYYWIGLHPLEWKQRNQYLCDFDAIKDNYVSITPIQLDLTSYEDMVDLNNWIKE